jgi:hypothetical protein
MPLGFANFRHDPTLSGRDRQNASGAVAPKQKPASSAASVTSQQPLIEEKKTNG